MQSRMDLFGSRISLHSHIDIDIDIGLHWTPHCRRPVHHLGFDQK